MESQEELPPPPSPAPGISPTGPPPEDKRKERMRRRRVARSQRRRSRRLAQSEHNNEGWGARRGGVVKHTRRDGGIKHTRRWVGAKHDFCKLYLQLQPLINPVHRYCSRANSSDWAPFSLTKPSCAMFGDIICIGAITWNLPNFQVENRLAVSCFGNNDFTSYS